MLSVADDPSSGLNNVSAQWLRVNTCRSCFLCLWPPNTTVSYICRTYLTMNVLVHSDDRENIHFVGLNQNCEDCESCR